MAKMKKIKNAKLEQMLFSYTTVGREFKLAQSL